VKLLLIHCDHFSYLTTRRTESAEEVEGGCKSCAFKDALVVFVTVEKADEKGSEEVAAKGVEEIVAVTKKVGAKNIVLFPFVHLSEDVSATDIALKTIQSLYEGVKAMNYVVDKAPFGWEKVFSMTSKGHPLAELSRTIRV